jgi:hypothetical protein
MNDGGNEQKAYDVTVAGDQLSIVVGRSFDSASLQQDWASAIIAMHPGPFTVVRVDLAKARRASSTFYAGLMQLHVHYAKGSAATPVALVNADRSIVANLDVLRLKRFFLIA